jgi:hypothetical protein
VTQCPDAAEEHCFRKKRPVLDRLTVFYESFAGLTTLTEEG